MEEEPRQPIMTFFDKYPDIPMEVIPLNVISIGWLTGEEKPKDKFNPEQIHWEKWKE